MKAVSHWSTSVEVQSHPGHVGLSGTVNLKMFLKDVNLYPMLLIILKVMLCITNISTTLSWPWNSTSSPVILLREHQDRCHNPNLSRITFIFELTVSGGASWRWGAVQTNHPGSSLFWRAYRFGSDCLTDGAASSRNGSSNTWPVRKSYGPIWWLYRRLSAHRCQKKQTRECQMKEWNSQLSS